MNILVLCTGNSARSILLEAILNRLGGSRVRAYSAGSQPTGHVHPHSLKLLAELGFDTSGARSKSWDEFALADAPVMDIVITVCASAAGETCPLWPGTPLRAHWGVADPATQDETAWETAFRTAYEQLLARATALMNLPLEDMEKTKLQEELTRIGTEI